MSGLHVSEHVFVTLNQHLGVLLAVDQLLVPISLNALEQIANLGRLHLAQSLLFVVENRHHFFVVLLAFLAL